MGLNITVMSYCGSLDFGIVADRGQMPDVALLMDWLREALAELMPAPVVTA
jgi:diacylglycerol O-acyltransferase / wax synthase